MNKITINDKNQPKPPLKKGQFYIRHDGEVKEIYLVIHLDYRLRLARLNDGVIWDRHTTWNNCSDQFTLVTSPFTVEPHYENH